MVKPHGENARMEEGYDKDDEVSGFRGPSESIHTPENAAHFSGNLGKRAGGAMFSAKEEPTDQRSVSLMTTPILFESLSYKISGTIHQASD